MCQAAREAATSLRVPSPLVRLASDIPEMGPCVIGDVHDHIIGAWTRNSAPYSEDCSVLFVATVCWTVNVSAYVITSIKLGCLALAQVVLWALRDLGGHKQAREEKSSNTLEGAEDASHLKRMIAAGGCLPRPRVGEARGSGGKCAHALGVPCSHWICCHPCRRAPANARPLRDEHNVVARVYMLTRRHSFVVQQPLASWRSGQSREHIVQMHAKAAASLLFTKPVPSACTFDLISGWASKDQPPTFTIAHTHKQLCASEGGTGEHVTPGVP